MDGVWSLDLERSESMNDLLVALGVSELARLAADRLDIELNIQLAGDTVQLTQTSQLGVKTRLHKLGATLSEPSREGAAPSELTLRGLEPRRLALSTRFWGGVLDDERWVDDAGELRQTLSLSAGGRRFVVARTYRRGPKPGAVGAAGAAGAASAVAAASFE
jgi:hypothetical protein